MKVFIATPYTQLCNPNNNLLKSKYKSYFIRLLDELDNLGVETFLAMKRENWGKEYTSDVESTNIDYETIKESDLVVAIPGIPHSGGVHVELGWASAYNRKIRIFLNKNHNYSPMVTGLHTLCDVKYYEYNDEFSLELFKLILKVVKEEKEKIDYV